MFQKIFRKYYLVSIICFFFFLIYVYIIFFIFPSHRLFGDEVFYWFQAKAIRESGKFVNFQNTQPLLFPLTLSLFKNLNLARSFSVILIILSGIIFAFYLTKYLEVRDKNFLIIFTLLIFFSFPFSFFFATSLHTEALFIFFLILIFCFFPKFLEKPSFKNLIIFGIILGLALETRIVGLPLLFFLLIWSIIYKKFHFRHLFSYFIAIAIFLPYLLVGGFSFLQAKSSPVFDLENYSLILVNRIYQIFYFWSFFTVLFLLGFFYAFKIKNIVAQFHLLLIIYILIISFLTPFTFLRYWYILTPSFTFIISNGIIYLKPIIEKILKGKILFILLLLFLLVVQLNFNLRKKEFFFVNKYYNNHYFLKIPSDCMEIKNIYFVDASKKNELEKYGKKTELPIFDQPPNSLYEYFTSFIPEKDYNFLILNYFDDKFALALNSEVIVKESSFSLFNHAIFQIHFPAKEKIILNLLIENEINVGGIGQIMICQKDPYQI